MTCIAGIAENGKVWIGGDSAGLAGWSLTVRADEKVFRKAGCVFGFTTSFRMGDLIRFAFDPPEQASRQKDREYLATTWVDALRACFTAGGFKKAENGVETGGTFLVGYRGQLYKVSGDFQIGAPLSGYDACGCGEEVAMGALYATTGDPRQRVLMALHAAEQHSGTAQRRSPRTVQGGFGMKPWRRIKDIPPLWYVNMLREEKLAVATEVNAIGDRWEWCTYFTFDGHRDISGYSIPGRFHVAPHEVRGRCRDQAVAWERAREAADDARARWAALKMDEMRSHRAKDVPL